MQSLYDPNVGSNPRALFRILPSNESEPKERKGNAPSARGHIISSLRCGSVSIASPLRIPRAMSVCPANATLWLHGNLESSSSQEMSQTFSDVTSGVRVFTAVAGSGQSELWLCCFFKVPEHITELLTSVSNCSVAVFFFSPFSFSLHCTSVWRDTDTCLPIKPQKRADLCQEKYLPSSQGCVLMQEYFGVKQWGYYTFLPYSMLAVIWTSYRASELNNNKKLSLL